VTHRSPSAPDRLVAAALVEFARHRRAGARTGRIAGRAGVNKQLIHYYFGTKDGLYAAVLTRVAAETGAAMARVPLIGLTAVERLRRLVRGQFDFLAEHPDHTTLLAGAETGGEWADQAIRPVLELLTEGQATGFFRDDVEPLHHARLALVLNLGYFALGPVTRPWGPAVQWRDRAADLIVRGCTW
jgi:AcrR family transcriptional regulator